MSTLVTDFSDSRDTGIREWASKTGWIATTSSDDTLCVEVEKGDILIRVSFFVGSDEAQFEFHKAIHMVIVAIPCNDETEQLLALLEKFRRTVPAELPEFLMALIDNFPESYDCGSGNVVPVDMDYVRAISEWAR